MSGVIIMDLRLQYVQIWAFPDMGLLLVTSGITIYGHKGESYNHWCLKLHVWAVWNHVYSQVGRTDWQTDGHTCTDRQTGSASFHSKQRPSVTTITFGIAAFFSVDFTTILCGVTGIIHTVPGVILCTVTPSGAAVLKDDLSRLKKT